MSISSGAGRRSIDFAKLTHMTKPVSIEEETLSESEVQEVVMYLIGNVPEIIEMLAAAQENTVVDEIVMERVEEIVRKSQVMVFRNECPLYLNTGRNEIDSDTANDSKRQDLKFMEQNLDSEISCNVMQQALDTATSEPTYIYKRGKVANACTLVLDGRIAVNEEGREEPCLVGPWSCLAAEVLVTEEGMLIPKFSAYVASDYVRCLRILKLIFTKSGSCKVPARISDDGQQFSSSDFDTEPSNNSEARKPLRKSSNDSKYIPNNINLELPKVCHLSNASKARSMELNEESQLLLFDHTSLTRKQNSTSTFQAICAPSYRDGKK